MASNKKEEPAVIFPRTSVEDDAIADLRDALHRLRIPEEQQELILEQLIIPPPAAAAAPSTPVASVVAAPSAVAVAATSGTDKAATAAVDNDVDTTHGSDNLMDDEVGDTYGDDDDDDDDSGYDGNVQYPYHPQPQSKIQYDSDEDSVEDYEFSQQINYN